MVSHYLGQCWLVHGVELCSGPRVGAIGRATRRYPEGAACGGTMDGAVLVDVHLHQAIHNVVFAHGTAIGRE
jgi:hypothetical protein